MGVYELKTGGAQRNGQPQPRSLTSPSLGFLPSNKRSQDNPLLPSMDAAREDQVSSSPTPANSTRPPRPKPLATTPTNIGSSIDDYVAL